MKITCVMVESVDGKTTRWFNPHLHEWTSKEDQSHFAKLIDEASLVIMGRKTYEAAKLSMKHKPGRLRVVITSKPEQFANETIPQQLEFVTDNPQILIKKLEDQGFTDALLVGGSTINTLFFKAQLVNELLVTIEPKLLGKGNGLVSEEELDINLELVNVEKLNAQGTILVTYILNHLPIST